MSQTVATGSIVLTLDASQLNAGMKKAAAKAKQDGKTVGGNFKHAAGDILKEKTGGDQGILGMGMKAGVIGAGLAAVAVAGKEIWDVVSPVKELEKALEEAADTNKKWRESVQDSINIEKEWIGSLSSIAGTAEGLKGFEDRLENIKSKAGAFNDELKATKKTKEDLEIKWGSVDNFTSWLGGSLEARQKAAKTEYDAAKAAKDAADKEIRDTALKLSRLRNPLTNPEAVAAHRDFIRDLQYQTAEIEGQSAEYSKLQRLKEQFNLTAGQMGAAAAAIETKELAQRTKDADELIKTLTADVMELAGVARQTAEEEKLAELMAKGIDGDKASRIKALIALKKQEAMEYKPLTGLQRGSAAEIGFQNKSRFEEARNKAIEKQLEELKKQSKILGDVRTGVFKLDKPEPTI